MLKLINRAYEWFTLADYESAKVEATNKVVRRYTRGNVSAQNGWFLSDSDLRKLSIEGDSALARLKKKVGQSA